MKTLAIVVGVVHAAGSVLMLRRSEHHKHAAGKWEPIGGFLKVRESAENAVLRRAVETAGLDARIVKVGPAFECEDAGAWWLVKPFLLEVDGHPRTVRLTGRHVDFCWVTPLEALGLDCVDGLREDFEALSVAG